MDPLYTLKIKRDPARSASLTVRYESRELALAAAAVYREQCPVVTVIGPDGAEIEDNRACRA